MKALSFHDRRVAREAFSLDERKYQLEVKKHARDRLWREDSRIGLLATLALTAIGQQFLLHIAAAHNPLNFFSYFTNLSNLFAAFVLMLSVFFRSSQSDALDIARYVSAVNTAVVGIVFVALLRNVDLGALPPWVNFVLHSVMPVAVVLDWVFRPPNSRLKAKYLALALLFPAAYLVCVLLRPARAPRASRFSRAALDPATAGGAA